MVGGPVHFTGDYSLNFAWKGRKLMYDLLGVLTHSQFLNKLETLATDIGTATIPAAATTLVVSHNLATTPTNVVLTPKQDTVKVRYSVSAKNETDFIISIDKVADSEISFDWKAVVEGTTSGMYEKIIYAGIYGKHPEVKLEPKDEDPEDSVYVEDIIEQYFNEGHGLPEFEEIIQDAFVTAGLLNGNMIKFERIIKQIRCRDDIKRVLVELDKKYENIEKMKQEIENKNLEVKDVDKGNRKKASTNLN